MLPGTSALASTSRSFAPVRDGFALTLAISLKLVLPGSADSGSDLVLHPDTERVSSRTTQPGGGVPPAQDGCVLIPVPCGPDRAVFVTVMLSLLTHFSGARMTEKPEEGVCLLQSPYPSKHSWALSERRSV